MDLKKYIQVTADFPRQGISFKDMSPLLRNEEAFKYAIDEMVKIAKEYNPTVVLGPESRGFIFGTPVAYELGIGFVMARKRGKLPGKTLEISYDLEYGTDSLFISDGIIRPNDRVLLIDDLLATGGTLGALNELVNKIGAKTVLALTLIELVSIPKSNKLSSVERKSLIQYRQ